MYMGQSSVYTQTFRFEKNENCIVCSSQRINQVVPKTIKLQEFRDELIEKYSLSNPSLASESQGNLYIPGVMAKKLESRLKMTMEELVIERHVLETDTIEVTDKVIPTVMRIRLNVE